MLASVQAGVMSAVPPDPTLTQASFVFAIPVRSAKQLYPDESSIVPWKGSGLANPADPDRVTPEPEISMPPAENCTVMTYLKVPDASVGPPHSPSLGKYTVCENVTSVLH